MKAVPIALTIEKQVVMFLFAYKTVPYRTQSVRFWYSTLKAEKKKHLKPMIYSFGMLVEWMWLWKSTG